MKKIIVSLVLFSVLIFGSSVSFAEALTLDEARRQIQSLSAQVTQLRSLLGGRALEAAETEVIYPTLTNPSITVLTPNGGESYIAGQEIVVRWESTNISANEDVNVTLTHNSPSACVNETVKRKNTGLTIYKLLGGGQCAGYGKNHKMEVRLANNSTVSDSSNDTFTINSQSELPSIKLVFPNGNETFAEGQAVNIKWETKNIPSSAKVGIDLFSSKDANRGITLANAKGESLFLNDGQETIIIPKINQVSTWQYGNFYKFHIGLDGDYFLDSNFIEAVDISDNFSAIQTTALPICYINSLSANPTLVVGEGSSTISWDTTDCNSVYIIGPALSEVVPAKGSHTERFTNDHSSIILDYTIYASAVQGCESAVYSLTTGQACNHVIKTVHVEHKRKEDTTCSINSFTANPSTINSNDTTMLSWNTTGCGALSIFLDNGVNLPIPQGLSIDNGSVRTESQSSTRTYTLAVNSTLPSGCSSLLGFSNTTGRSCSEGAQTKNVTVTVKQDAPILPPGCTSNVGYSPTTGQPCFTTPIYPPGCTSNLGYSSTTGQPCSGTGGTPPTPGGPGLHTSSTTTTSFTRGLRVGVRGDDVTALQEKLRTEGIYAGPVTGYYGALTREAVQKYQAKYNLPSVGVVGPQTLQLLNR